MIRPIGIALVLATVAGCGDNYTLPPDAAKPDGPGPFMTAPHTPLPLAIPHDGVILDHVQLVTITYANYADQAMVEAFADAAVTSEWYAAVGAEYGVGAGTNTNVRLAVNAPVMLSDSQIVTLIRNQINNGTLPTPPATNSKYVYMFYVPSTVLLDPSLQDLYGFHDESTTTGTNPGRPFSYAVIVDDGTGIDTTTTTASHELIEAATDPYFTNGNLGWYTDPPLPDPWYLLLGEVADLCNFEPYTFEGGFAYQRSWSNAAAAAGDNPCIPNGGDNAWEDVTAEPATMPTIAKGSSATFTLTGWSTVKEADWVLDYADADYSTLYASDLNVMFGATMINNKKTATVTLHAPTTAASGDTGGIYILSGVHQRPWAVGFSVQ